MASDDGTYCRAYSYDPACYALAEHFLGTSAPELEKKDLAQDIQNVVEMATQDHIFAPSTNGAVK